MNKAQTLECLARVVDALTTQLCKSATTKEFFQTSVALGCVQIMHGIHDGTVPHGVIKTFGDLHDYVDANEYGGLCDSAVTAAANKLMPHKAGEDCISSGDYMDLANDIQNRLDLWIREGDFKNLPQLLD